MSICPYSNKEYDLAERYLQSVKERGERTGGRSVETEVRRKDDLVSEKCDSVTVL